MVSPVSPLEVVRKIGSWNPLEHMELYRSDEFGLQWVQSNPEFTGDDEGEYAVVESTALPFYLQYLWDQKENLFEVVTVPLSILELLLDHIQKCQSESNLSIDKYVQEHYHLQWQSAKGSKKKARIQRKLHAVMMTLQHLCDSEVCVLPSVLLMSKRHQAREW
jgi:hypothetical protein